MINWFNFALLTSYSTKGADFYPQKLSSLPGFWFYQLLVKINPVLTKRFKKC